MPRYVEYKQPKKQPKRPRASERKYSVHGYKGFLDPFPLGFGTEPEKIVYDALSIRGIDFYYLNNIHFSFPEIEGGFEKTFQADFIIPAAHIIIEIQGAHWHSMAATIDADAYKFAVYQEGGYTPLAWWDYDILDDVNKLFAGEPALLALAKVTTGHERHELTPMNRTKTDTSKGIRTLNKKRAARLEYRKRPPKMKGKVKTYGTYRAYTR